MPAPFLNGIDVNNQRVINVASPSAATDAANKAYVDGAINGLSWKQPVRVATTTNGALSTAYANGSTIDGVTLATGDRVLIKDQTTGSENGIVVVNASGAPTRTNDANTTAQLNNATVYVMSGSVNADKAFTQTVDNPTVNTTALTFAQVGGGTAYTAGTGILIASNQISSDYTLTARKAWQSSVATTAGTEQTYTHSLGSVDVEVIVIEVSTGKRVYPDTRSISSTSVGVTSGTAVTAGQYRIGVIQ